MAASRQVGVLFCRGIGRQSERAFVPLAQSFARSAIGFLRHYIVPAPKRVSADLLEFAVPDIAEVVRCRKISEQLQRL